MYLNMGRDHVFIIHHDPMMLISERKRDIWDWFCHSMYVPFAYVGYSCSHVSRGQWATGLDCFLVS